MLKEIRGLTQDGASIKSTGDEIVVDGTKYEVEVVEIFFDEYADTHNFTYQLKPVIVKELTEEELQQL